MSLDFSTFSSEKDSDWFNQAQNHRTIVEVGGVVSDDTTITEYTAATVPLASSAAEAIVKQSGDALDKPSWGMTL